MKRGYRWPKRGDRLLQRSKNWYKSAEFEQERVGRHVHIWTGYKRAADALVEECERDSLERSILIYPILFNYRHALELAMKWVIEQYGLALVPEKKNHNLWKLWALCRQTIIELLPECEDDEAVHAVEQIVKDFHDLDKSGMGFRYSTTKKGVTIKLPDTAIDLENIQDVMEGVDHFFSGVDGQLTAQ
jgi:hypothetical protein